MVDVEFKIISIGEIKEAQMVRKNISNINRIIRLKIFSIGSVISFSSTGLEKATNFFGFAAKKFTCLPQNRYELTLSMKCQL